MFDLSTQVKTRADALRAAWTSLQSLSRCALPPKCFVRCIESAGLDRLLDGTALIFPAKLAAWENVQTVVSAPCGDPARPNKIPIDKQSLDYAVARHISLLSYLAAACSIYDRFSNACNRIAGTSGIGEHPKQKPKACEDFLGKKDILGLSCHYHIQHASAWPPRVTYKIRTWLVHEGCEEKGITLFQGDSIRGGFRLHHETARHIEECCGYISADGRIVACCLAAAEKCWPTRELLTILNVYHAELDTLFAGLAKWSVDSFAGQIAAFTAKDRY